MAYIDNEKIAEIRNALAVILRSSFDTKQDNRLLIVRQVGRIGGLLPQIKYREGLARPVWPNLGR